MNSKEVAVEMSEARFPEDPSRVIIDKSKRYLRAYLSTRDDWEVAPAIKELQRQASHEYTDRALVELIQNGYDAHQSMNKLGVVKILLDRREGKFGTLYVANTGQPFNRKEFKSISEFARSSKTKGAGIGYKGIGFRSVLNLCRSPEVYSKKPGEINPKEFSGFCFGFADKIDVRKLLGDNEQELSDVWKNVSRYSLPIPILKQNETVKYFAGLGMSTVVRLEINSEVALTSVLDQIDSLRSSDVPLMLFLIKLNRLEITTIDESGAEDHTVLSRRARKIKTKGETKNLYLEIANLAEQGRFFVSRKRVEPKLLKKTIKKAVDKDELDESWLEWNDEAWVELGVRIDEEQIDHRLYVFFPMGISAKSPMPGHLNAPFYTRLARMELREQNTLNSLLLDIGAQASAESALLMRESKISEKNEIVADLISWKSPYHERLVNAFDEKNIEFKKEALIPIIKKRNNSEWSSLESTFCWEDDGLKLITAEKMAANIKVDFLSNKLGERRIKRIRELHSTVTDKVINPDDETAAKWCEELAGRLIRRNTNVKIFSKYYEDLAHYFSECPNVLAGKKILLDDSGSLQAAEAAKDKESKTLFKTIFFPPAKETGDEGDEEEIDFGVDVSIPRTFRRHICYMHPDLNWYETIEGRRRLTKSRRFLRDNGLVRTFRTRSVLEHISHILERTKSRNVMKDALEYVYRLQAAMRSDSTLHLNRLNLKVPTIGGWRPAEEAFLSRTWMEDAGVQIENLISEGRGISQDLDDLEGSLLISRNKWPFSVKSIPEYASFLERIGVSDGLKPITVGPHKIEQEGTMFKKRNLWFVAQKLMLSEKEKDLWIEDVKSRGDFPYHHYTPYRIETPFWKLPGQYEFNDFSDRTKSIYSRLVFKSIANWDDSVFNVSIKRFKPHHRKNPDECIWPTPLNTFLTEMAWVPIIYPGKGQIEQFVVPRDGWFFSDAAGTAPRYAPQLPRDIRRIIENNAEAYERLRDAGLNDWNNPQDSISLIKYLGCLFAQGAFKEDGNISAFLRAYQKAWETFIEEGLDPESLPEDDDFVLVVNKGFRLAVVPVNGDPDAVDNLYILDDTDKMKESALANLKYPTIKFVSDKAASLREILNSYFPDKVKLTSEIDIIPTTNGKVFKPSDADIPIVNDDTSWLPAFVGLVLQFFTGSFVHVTERMLSECMERVSRIRIHHAEKLGFLLDGNQIELPQYNEGVLSVNDIEKPRIILNRDFESITWSILELIGGEIADIINQKHISRDLKYAFIQLGRLRGEEKIYSPGIKELSYVFEETAERISDALRSFKSTVLKILEFLIPVLSYYEGVTAVEAEYHQLEELKTEEELKSFLKSMPGKTPYDPEKILDMCRNAVSLGDLRDQLGMEYGEFNDTLKKLGSPYKPIHNVEGQRQFFEYYKKMNGERILDPIRSMFLTHYEKREDLDDYLALRKLDDLKPNKDWLDICDVPTDEMMNGWATKWLRSIGSGALSDRNPSLVSLEKTHEGNRTIIKETLKNLGNIVRAWCRSNSEVPPEFWDGTDPDVVIIEGLMYDKGLLDFKIVNAVNILGFLKSEGKWPGKMPLTKNLDKLSISREDILSQEKELEIAAQAKIMKKRAVIIDGHPVVADAGEFNKLSDLIRSGLTEELLGKSIRVSQLEKLPDKKAQSGGGIGGGGKSGRRTKEDLSPDQKLAVGFIGEVIAFEWLKANYQNDVDQDCWKSAYRTHLYGGDPGDDNLGYDFEVILKSRTRYYEVKATTTDRMEIELGESQVKFARKYAISKERIFNIIYIPNILDSEARSIHVLPNPFSREGEAYFRFVGTGLKYQFQLSD